MTEQQRRNDAAFTKFLVGLGVIVLWYVIAVVVIVVLAVTR